MAGGWTKNNHYLCGGKRAEYQKMGSNKRGKVKALITKGDRIRKMGPKYNWGIQA